MFERNQQYFLELIYRENPNNILKTAVINGYFLPNFWFLLLLFPLSDKFASDFTDKREAPRRKVSSTSSISLSISFCFPFIGFPSCDYGGLYLLWSKLNASIYALVISLSYFQNFPSAILLLFSVKNNKTPLLIPQGHSSYHPISVPPLTFQPNFHYQTSPGGLLSKPLRSC